MAGKFSNRTLREFPFLEDLDKELGVGVHFRVRKISYVEVKLVKNLPQKIGYVTNVIREYPSSVEGEGILMLWTCVDYHIECVPPMYMTTLFKFKKRGSVYQYIQTAFWNRLKSSMQNIQ